MKMTPDVIPNSPSLRARSALILVLVLLSLHGVSHAQGMSGFVEDAITSERLIGATIWSPRLQYGVVTNANGFFSLDVDSAAEMEVEVRYIGYQTQVFQVSLGTKAPVILKLQPASVDMEAATVSARRVEQFSAIALSPAEIERSPTLLGESDPLKALQKTPAAGFGSEGSSGIHVRGSPPDQTLLLLDGATIYNASHLLGVVSVFNADAVQTVSFYPGVPPARFGDRLAGVIDVSLRDGSRERFQGTATVGLLASRMTAEGPLLNQRGSFIVSARRSYLDILARPFLYTEGSSGGYHYGDLNLKANVDVGTATRLYIGAYGGVDDLYSNAAEVFRGVEGRSTTSIGWGNRSGTIRVAHALQPNVFLTGSAVGSDYAFRAHSEEKETVLATGAEEVSGFTLESGIREYAGRFALDMTLGQKRRLQLGSNVYHRSFRGLPVDRDENDAGHADIGGSVFADGEVALGAKTDANVGIRVSLADSGKLAAIQPRLSITHRPSEALTVRLNGGKTWQPVHLLTNPGIGLPTDLWIPAASVGAAASAWQASGEGTYSNGRGLSVTIGVYAKRLRGVVAYADAPEGFRSGGSDIDVGAGSAYGLELAVARQIGRADITVSYAFSRSKRMFERINGGESFPYRYERPHDLSVSTSYRLSPRRTVTAAFTAASGTAVTVPIARYGFNEVLYGPRNGGRFPTYHRLDVSYEIRYGRGRLALGVYNVYNRLNPYYLKFDREYDAETDSVRDGYRSYSLFPFLPSVSYRLSL